MGKVSLLCDKWAVLQKNKFTIIFYLGSVDDLLGQACLIVSLIKISENVSIVIKLALKDNQ